MPRYDTPCDRAKTQVASRCLACVLALGRDFQFVPSHSTRSRQLTVSLQNGRQTTTTIVFAPMGGTITAATSLGMIDEQVGGESDVVTRAGATGSTGDLRVDLDKWEV